MKAKVSLGIVVFLLATLTLSLALANFHLPVATAQPSFADAAANQVHIATAQAGDDSETVSMDGILAMGIVITLIVTLPMFFRRSK
jgi:hypothetical protein